MKIGAAQIHLYPSIEKNLKNITHWMRVASDQGVEILNFPETCLTGYIYEAFHQVKQEEVDRGLDTIAGLAQELRIGAVVGTPWRMGERLFNSVVAFLPDGMRFLYHKNMLVSYEKAYFEHGTDILTFEAGGLKFGTIICRDQNFPELARRIKSNGAHVLFISCAHFYVPLEARMKVEKNRALPIVRAYENELFVCKANAVGTYLGRINLGHSLIVGPNGVVICEAGETQEELLAFDIDPLNMEWRW
jgi:predicted amidohydrolase